MTTDPIKALVDQMKDHIEQYYGTEHTPIFNWSEWETILEALTPIADGTQGRDCKMAWKQGFCYGDPEYYPAPSASTGKDVPK